MMNAAAGAGIIHRRICANCVAAFWQPCEKGLAQGACDHLSGISAPKVRAKPFWHAQVVDTKPSVKSSSSQVEKKPFRHRFQVVTRGTSFLLPNFRTA